MGSLLGYLDYKRRDFAYKSVGERIRNFDEFITMHGEAEMRRQAARCMACETPYCHALGCPSASRVSEWSDAVLRNDIPRAYESLSRTNLFPEFTGRVCPALCEYACSLAIETAPVAIRQIEWYIIEKAFETGLVKPAIPREKRGERVAVVGSGPSGLAAALILNRAGYRTTVYDKAAQPGGLMRYGIPGYKLPRQVLDRRISLLEREGVRFEMNVEIGRDMEPGRLLRDNEATILCLGAETPRDLNIENRCLKGIHFAVDYLSDASRFLAGKKAASDIISAHGKTVLVIGGGDTGSDCIGTAIRQGARQVTQIEILPKPPEWPEARNPAWPWYPVIYRTSSSHLEGCNREFSVLTRSFTGHDGKVTGAWCCRVVWSKDTAGQMTQSVVMDSDFFIEADLVLLSMGFHHVRHDSWMTNLGIRFDNRGHIQATEQMTSIPGLFVAGDASTGASLVCKSIESGRKAAQAVDRYLSQ